MRTLGFQMTNLPQFASILVGIHLGSVFCSIRLRYAEFSLMGAAWELWVTVRVLFIEVSILESTSGFILSDF